MYVCVWVVWIYASTVVQTSGSKLAMVKKMKLCPMAEQMEKYRIFCRISGLFRQNCRPDEPACMYGAERKISTLCIPYSNVCMCSEGRPSPRATDSTAAVMAMYRLVQNMKS